MIVETAGNFITKKIKFFLAKSPIAWQNHTNAIQSDGRIAVGNSGEEK